MQYVIIDRSILENYNKPKFIKRVCPNLRNVTDLYTSPIRSYIRKTVLYFMKIPVVLQPGICSIIN